MNKLIYSKPASPVAYLLKIAAYSFIALIVQGVWISRLPYQAFRIDLLLPLMFAIALGWPPLGSILWGALLGFIMDVLSGSFWGFHVGSYVIVVCMTNIATERFEFDNPIHQMGFIGICSLGQSIALGLYLLFSAAGGASFATTWTSLILRSLITMVAAPFLLFPVLSAKKGFGQ